MINLYDDVPSLNVKNLKFKERMSSSWSQLGFDSEYRKFAFCYKYISIFIQMVNHLLNFISIEIKEFIL